MEGLKPCPFCGSEDVYDTFRQEHWFGTKEPIVFCNTCKAEFSVEDDSQYTDVGTVEDCRNYKMLCDIPMSQINTLLQVTNRSLIDEIKALRKEVELLKQKRKR